MFTLFIIYYIVGIILTIIAILSEKDEYRIGDVVCAILLGMFMGWITPILAICSIPLKQNKE